MARKTRLRKSFLYIEGWVYPLYRIKFKFECEVGSKFRYKEVIKGLAPPLIGAVHLDAFLYTKGQPPKFVYILRYFSHNDIGHYMPLRLPSE